MNNKLAVLVVGQHRAGAWPWSVAVQGATDAQSRAGNVPQLVVAIGNGIAPVVMRTMAQAAGVASYQWSERIPCPPSYVVAQHIAQLEREGYHVEIWAFMAGDWKQWPQLVIPLRKLLRAGHTVKVFDDTGKQIRAKTVESGLRDVARRDAKEREEMRREQEGRRQQRGGQSRQQYRNTKNGKQPRRAHYSAQESIKP